MNKLAEIDAKLIDLTQDAYLWLYDRCGVYIATVSVALIVAGRAIDYKGPLSMVGTAIICLLMSQRYLFQLMGMKELINASARRDRAATWRYLFIIFMLLLAVLPSRDWALDAVSILFDIAAIAYVGVVQLRDREPKDFIPKLAMVRANAR